MGKNWRGPFGACIGTFSTRRKGSAAGPYETIFPGINATRISIRQWRTWWNRSAAKILPVVRSSRGRVWFYANWGYEESKHSLALGDWLLRSRHRTEEQMADLERNLYEREWNLPQDSQLGMLVYAMAQELATGLNYRNLRRRVKENGGDPALEKLLMLVSVDEQAHYRFFRESVQLFLKHNPEATLEQMRRVMNNFSMPAIHEMADSRERVAQIKSLEIFSEDIYYREVYLPVLAALNVDRREMRNRLPSPKTAPVQAP
jgi:acyl-[acyl-carrier-protein] desaturase